MQIWILDICKLNFCSFVEIVNRSSFQMANGSQNIWKLDIFSLVMEWCPKTKHLRTRLVLDKPNAGYKGVLKQGPCTCTYTFIYIYERTNVPGSSECTRTPFHYPRDTTGIWIPTLSKWHLSTKTQVKHVIFSKRPLLNYVTLI